MASELRKTGISVVGDLPWGAHFCYFYETKQDLLDILIPYFKTGLENKEFCLWVISNSELLTVEEATIALRNALPNLDRYVAERSIEVVGHDDWFLSGKTFDPHKVANRFKNKLNEALARGYAGMRVNGSPAWLQDAGPKELRKFEAELEKLFPNERTIASCTYPLAKIGGDEIFDVVRTHQFAIARRQGEWEIIETPELIQAKAEIKSLNEELEQRVIERTNELRVANEELRKKIADRKQIERELRESQQQYEALVHSIDGIVWAVNAETFRFTFVSKQAERILGYPLSQWLEPNFWADHLHPDDRDWAVRFCVDATQRKVDHQFEYRMIAAGGRVVWLRDHVTVTVLMDQSVRLSGVMFDITERMQAEERLRATSEQLRALSASLQAAREEEATRIAREIHDELGAALSSLRWDLEEVDESISESPDQSQLQELRKKIEAMMRLTDTTINTVRRIASEMRPIALDALGLVEAIEWQARQFQDRTGIIVQCDCTLENLDLSRERSTAVFRIFQEALTNILRHAQATRVNVQINEEDGEFILTISDNGRGITVDEKSGQRTLGLLGMRERAHLIGGKINITGSEGKGTVVTVRIPISA